MARRANRIVYSIVGIVIGGIVILLGILSLTEDTSGNTGTQEKKIVDTGNISTEIDKAISKGSAYLMAQMNDRGACEVEIRGERFEDPGITAMVLTALSRIENRDAAMDSLISKGAEYLVSLQKENGGIYPDNNSAPPTYVTSVSVLALNGIDKKKYAEPIRKAQRFLAGMQGIDEEDTGKYGGFGYGPGQEKKSSDMSATAYALTALKESGYDDDEVFKRAITFINRCQNDSETNDLPQAGDDGGMVYKPLESQDFEAGGVKHVARKQQSYGAMTYQGIKSYIYAGLTKDDVRVQRALKWIRDNYTVDKNPGQSDGDSGLFYYFNTFGKTMTVLEFSEFEDSAGFKHDWRGELAAAIISLQNEDGSWQNQNNRWYENIKPLVTAYALTALTYCR